MISRVGGLFGAAFVIGASLIASGCYYTQAVRGQLEVVAKREPIDDVLVASDTAPELKERLRLVEEARQFTIDELAMPDNDSYRSYADLERDYVVWNVVAAPEFSLEAKTWCYPFVGCVSYRGYFAEDAARRKADALEKEGFDVAVGGVAAYSTLGRFDDPVLNTMMHWDDVDLVALLIHELAHQVLYVKDDSGFNESFATAVEEFGVERWLEHKGDRSKFTAWQYRRAARDRLIGLITEARSDLEAVYTSSLDEDAMRSQKRERLDRLAIELQQELRDSGMEPPTWSSETLNNARLASMDLYRGRVDEFRALFAACNDDIHCFYDEARKLADQL